MTDEEAFELAYKEFQGETWKEAFNQNLVKLDLKKHTKKIFLAGIQYGERKGWNAAREGASKEKIDLDNYASGNGSQYKTFEDWQENKKK